MGAAQQAPLLFSPLQGGCLCLGHSPPRSPAQAPPTAHPSRTVPARLGQWPGRMMFQKILLDEHGMDSVLGEQPQSMFKGNNRPLYPVSTALRLDYFI